MTKIEPVSSPLIEDDIPSIPAVAPPRLVESVVPFTTAVENLSTMVDEINFRPYREIIRNNQSAELSRRIDTHRWAPTASFKTEIVRFEIASF